MNLSHAHIRDDVRDMDVDVCVEEEKRKQWVNLSGSGGDEENDQFTGHDRKK